MMNKVERLKRASPENIRRLYIDEQKPMHQVAKELGVSIGLIHKRIHAYGIQARDWKETFNFKGGKHTVEEVERIRKRHIGKVVTVETRKKMSEAAKLKDSGHTKKRTDGYIALYYPLHPSANKDGYIMKHRYLMEKHLGRALSEDEVVHHINGKKADNRIENMVVMTPSAHMSYHARQRHQQRKMENKNDQQDSFNW